LPGGRLRILLVVHGRGRVAGHEVKRGDTLLLPASMERAACSCDGVLGALLATLP
jgi:hypothetical protein